MLGAVLTAGESARWAAARALLGPGVAETLAVVGEPGLLERRPLVALFCSVRCPGEVILATFEVAHALREAGVAVIGGFHAPMEQEALRVLLRGDSPVLVCPARSLANLRVPADYRPALADRRLALVSSFEPSARRATASLAAARNLLVGALADRVLVLHAAPGGRVEAALASFLAWGKEVRALDVPANAALFERGALRWPG